MQQSYFPRRGQGWIGQGVALVVLFVGMLGVRVDRVLDPVARARQGVGWTLFQAIWLASVFVVQGVLFPGAGWKPVVSLFVLGWCIYYLGNALVLGTSVRSRILAVWGEVRGGVVYETLLGIMFQMQGLGVYATSQIRWSALFPGQEDFLLMCPSPWREALGILLIVVGVLVKMWATQITGIDTYYYQDMFLGRPDTKGFVARGPYRVLKNPMYGVGNWHTYGIALLTGSTPALLASVVCQLSIYGFYWALEQPFLQRMYCTPKDQNLTVPVL